MQLNAPQFIEGDFQNTWHINNRIYLVKNRTFYLRNSNYCNSRGENGNTTGMCHGNVLMYLHPLQSCLAFVWAQNIRYRTYLIKCLLCAKNSRKMVDEWKFYLSNLQLQKVIVKLSPWNNCVGCIVFCQGLRDTS